MISIPPTRRAGHRGNGQALVEFSLALVPFILLVMGIFDLGRGIYSSNGVTQAAREIARVTAVHPCNTSSCTLGNSPETLAVIATQRRMVPNFTASSVTISCSTIADATVPPTALRPCESGNYIRVTVSVPFTTLTPILSMVAPTTLVSTAHVEVP
jgi:Flp pilus assembly protein TadG